MLKLYRLTTVLTILFIFYTMTAMATNTNPVDLSKMGQRIAVEFGDWSPIKVLAIEDAGKVTVHGLTASVETIHKSKDWIRSSSVAVCWKDQKGKLIWLGPKRSFFVVLKNRILGLEARLENGILKTQIQQHTAKLDEEIAAACQRVAALTKNDCALFFGVLEKIDLTEVFGPKYFIIDLTTNPPPVELVEVSLNGEIMTLSLLHPTKGPAEIKLNCSTFTVLSASLDGKPFTIPTPSGEQNSDKGR